ncbi:hypothetical protein CsSME_00044839 [Camellia sinensis var. sinensis]
MTMRLPVAYERWGVKASSQIAFLLLVMVPEAVDSKKARTATVFYLFPLFQGDDGISPPPADKAVDPDFLLESDH